MKVSNDDIASGRLAVLPVGWQRFGSVKDALKALREEWRESDRAAAAVGKLPTGWGLISAADTDVGTVDEVIVDEVIVERRTAGGLILAVAKNDPDGNILTKSVPAAYDVVDVATGEVLANSPPPILHVVRLDCADSEVVFMLAASRLLPRIDGAHVHHVEADDSGVSVHLLLTQQAAQELNQDHDPIARRLQTAIHKTRLMVADDGTVPWCDEETDVGLLRRREYYKRLEWALDGSKTYDPRRLLAALDAAEKKAAA